MTTRPLTLWNGRLPGPPDQDPKLTGASGCTWEDPVALRARLTAEGFTSIRITVNREPA